MPEHSYCDNCKKPVMRLMCWKNYDNVTSQYSNWLTHVDLNTGENKGFSCKFKATPISPGYWSGTCKHCNSSIVRRFFTWFHVSTRERDCDIEAKSKVLGDSFFDLEDW